MLICFLLNVIDTDGCIYSYIATTLLAFLLYVISVHVIYDSPSWYSSKYEE